MLFRSESLAATTEEESETDEDLLRINQVKRRILQDSTLLSATNVSSVDDDPGMGQEELEIIGNEAKAPIIPDVVITDATATEEIDEDEEIPASPASSEYVTAPSSRRNTSSSFRDIASPTFDDTITEMALYEMFGEIGRAHV